MTLLLLVLAAGASTDIATQAVHNFGACVVRQTPRGAREALALDYRTPEYAEKVRDLAAGHERCAPGARLSFGGVLFAGALAEALVESEVKRADLPAQLAFDPARPKVDARDETEVMALCTAMRAPQATADLFATKPATKEEKAAMQGIAAVLPDCLAKDTKLTLNRPALRSLLALAAWRIVSTRRGEAQ